MWHSKRRYSSDSSGEDEVPYKTFHKKAGQSAMTLNLEWDWEEDKDRADSPRTLSLAGEERGNTKGKWKRRIGSEREERRERLGGDAGIEDSETDSFVNGEGGRLVKG